MIALLKDAGLVDLTSAAAYALAAYGLFRFLDRIASAQANQAISSWIRREPLKSIDLSVAVVSIFDRLYSTPLFGLRAFLRSTILTLVSVFLVVWYVYPVIFAIGVHVESLRYQWMWQISANIVADFLALFFIRRLLTTASPFMALVLAPIVAAAFVGFLTIAQDVARFSIHTQSFHPVYFLQGLQFWADVLRKPTMSSSKTLLLSNLVVYAWLPLFAISAVALRSVAITLKTVKLAQWFVKTGRQQPLHAVGLVAAAIVFFGVTLARLVLL